MDDSVMQLFPLTALERPLSGLYLAHDLRQYGESSSKAFLYANFITSLDGRIAINSIGGNLVLLRNDNERGHWLAVNLTEENGFVSPAGDNLPLGLENVVAVQAMFPVTSRDEMRGDRGDVDVTGRPNELALFADTDLRGIWNGIMERLLDIP